MQSAEPPDLERLVILVVMGNDRFQPAYPRRSAFPTHPPSPRAVRQGGQSYFAGLARRQFAWRVSVFSITASRLVDLMFHGGDVYQIPRIVACFLWGQAGGQMGSYAAYAPFAWWSVNRAPKILGDTESFCCDYCGERYGRCAESMAGPSSSPSGYASIPQPRIEP